MDLDVTDPMSTQTQYPSTNATSAITVTSPAPHNYSTHPGIALSAHHPQGYSTTNHPPSAPFELSHMLPYPGYPYVPNASSHGMTQGYPTAYGPQYSEPRYLPPSVVPYGGHVPHNYHNVPPNWNPQTNAYPDMNLGIHQNTVSQVPNELHYIAYMNTHHRSCRPLNALYGNEVYVHPSRFIPRQTTPLQFQGQSSEWPVNTSQAPPIQSEVIPPAVAIDKNLACTISTSSKQSSDFSSPQDDFGKSEEDGLNLPGCVLPTTPLYNDSSETYSPAAKRLRLTDRLERPSPSQSAVSCTSTPNITVQTESKQQLILSEKDFKSVHEKLYPIRSEWSNFGLALDLPPSTINQISKDHKSVQDCFYKTLDILFKSRELTWSKIIEALRKPTIQQNNLATEIESAIIAMDLPTPAPVSLVGNLSLEKLSLQFQGQSSEWPVNTSQAPPIQSEVIPPAVAIDKNLACTISTSSKQSSDFSSPQDDFGKSEEDGLNLPGCVLPTTPLYNDSSETYSPAAKRLRLTDRLERPSPSQSAVSCTSTPNITVQTESKQQLILSEKDFKSVHEKLYPIRSEWSNFGLALDLPPSTINQISKDHKSVQDCFYKTLDILFKSRELTWSKIIEALRKPTIQQNNLATEIESAIIAMDLPTPAPVSLVGNLSLEKLCRLPVDKVWYQLGLWLGVKEYRLIDIKTNNENIELLFKAFLESLYGSTDYRRLCELFTDVQKEQAQRLLESETYDDFIKLFPQDKRIDARKIVDISKALFPRLLTALIKVGKRDVAENICSKKGMKIVYMLIIMIQN